MGWLLAIGGLLVVVWLTAMLWHVVTFPRLWGEDE